MSLSQRQLGRNGPKVSAMGLGCMGMSQSYGSRDDEESVRTLEHALDIGVTFLDTAAVYGFGDNERLVGRVLKGRRAAVFLATKCGIVRGDDGRSMALDGSPGEIVSSCDASLARLGTDVIDLFYLHRVDARVPIEESVGAMARLVTEGKVRYLGLSEASVQTLRRASAVHPIAALQSEYSLWWREPEEAILPACRELGIGFVPFSPLGRGFLSGQVTDARALDEGDLRRSLPRFQGENLQRNVLLVSQLEAIASRKGCTASQLALAWLLAKGPDIVPIPGTKRRTYLESNVAAASLTLTESEVNELDAAFPAEAASGERYHAEMARWVDR